MFPLRCLYALEETIEVGLSCGVWMQGRSLKGTGFGLDPWSKGVGSVLFDFLFVEGELVKKAHILY